VSTPPTVVIVEDEIIIARELETRLQAMGYQVQGIALSGSEAINLVEIARPNLVLMDIALEGDIDGIEAASTIRQRWFIPFIYLTAYTDEATLLRAKVTKPYGYIVKPYAEPELRANIEMALYKHQVETKFWEALERGNAADWTTALDEACADDPALRQRAESLLNSLMMCDTMELQAMEPPSPQGIEIEPAKKDLPFLESTEIPGYLARLEHFELISLLGKGATGFVFKALDEALRRVVAIKVMVPRLAACAAARERFRRQARALAAIRSDYVIDVYAVGEIRGIPYLVTEYVNGLSLQRKISPTKPMALEQILHIGRQIASGLAAAHAEGLIHRDIKPSNILVEDHIDRVKITDFGLAASLDPDQQTQVGTISGTPEFMSPEQAEGKRLDHRTDLFSLGGLLYTMCTGQIPFKGSSTGAIIESVCEKSPRPIRELNPEIPENMVKIIDKLMAKNPDQRFASAKEVEEALRSVHLQSNCISA
jgi:CheY-like chemotaxis protein